MRILLRTTRADRAWLCLFAGWLVILSGALAPWAGGPGLFQWWKIARLVETRQQKMSEIESKIMEISAEQVRLEKSPAAQRREIRRVMGYLAPDEILFDFSSDPVQPSLARSSF